jgi:hypothetical protein
MFVLYLYMFNFVKFRVFMSVRMKMTVFLDVEQCGLVEFYQRFIDDFCCFVALMMEAGSSVGLKGATVTFLYNCLRIYLDTKMCRIMKYQLCAYGGNFVLPVYIIFSMLL